MPLSTAAPAPASSSLLGTMPIPATTRSHSRVRPPLVRSRSRRPAPSKAATASSITSSTPFSRWISASTVPTSLPRTRARGTGWPSMAVTASPIWRRDADTSEPMKPRPITTARAPERATARMRSRILHRPQLEDARKLRAGGGERPVPSARGDQEPVVRHLLAAVQADDFSPGIDAGDPDPEAELDVVLGVVVGGVDELVLEALLAPEVSLRQRRAIVRELRLRADELDGAVEAALAQSGGGAGPGQRSSDDDEPLMFHRAARGTVVPPSLSAYHPVRRGQGAIKSWPMTEGLDWLERDLLLGAQIP